jgi:hypothetical protein
MLVKYFVGTEGTATDAMSEFRVVGGTRTGDTLALQYKPLRGLTRTGDTINIADCRVIPASRIWPLFWTTASAFAGVTAVFEILRGGFMGAIIPALAQLGMLVWFPDVKRRFKYALISHPNGYIQPECQQDAALFENCKMAHVQDYIRGLRHKLDAWMPKKSTARQ